MKKRLTPILLATLALLFFVTSCTKKSEYLNSIPKDAFVVMSIDGKAWQEMAKPELLLENENYQDGIKELEQTSEKLAEFVETVLKNPNETGISFDGMIYGFAEMDDNNMIVGIIAGVDKKKLEENIEMLTKELEVEFKAEEKDGISYFMPEDDMILGWDKNKLIVLTLAEGYDYDLEKKFFALMDQKKDESILVDKDFNEFLKGCKDFNIWISSNVVNNIEDKDEITAAEKMVGFDFNDNFGHIYFESAKGEWTVTAKLRFNESIQNADWNKVIENLTEMGMLDEVFDLLGDFGGSEAKDDATLIFGLMEEFNIAAQLAIIDEKIDDAEVEELNSIIEEISTLSDEFDEKYKDDDAATKMIEEMAKDEANAKILSDMMEVMFKLYACKGSDKLQEMK